MSFPRTAALVLVRPSFPPVPTPSFSRPATANLPWSAVHVDGSPPLRSHVRGAGLACEGRSRGGEREGGWMAVVFLVLLLELGFDVYIVGPRGKKPPSRRSHHPNSPKTPNSLQRGRKQSDPALPCGTCQGGNQIPESREGTGSPDQRSIHPSMESSERLLP